jgi:hypothetical protein
VIPVNSEETPGTVGPAKRDPAAYDVRADWVAGGGPVVTVVEAVATATDRTPEGLAPITETVDPDAVDRLLTDARGSGGRETTQVSFRFEGCSVVADSRGRVLVAVEKP